VVLDFAIKNRGLNRYSYNDNLFREQEIKNFATQNGLKISKSVFLPLGRKLIKFTKSA